jgi:hypothetical protein
MLDITSFLGFSAKIFLIVLQILMPAIDPDPFITMRLKFPTINPSA